uniref:Caspase family p20 domain-containing protein n=1 Tax=Gadus morhua TaxID=8049 RepID=A0A8C5F7F9_GADMO
GIKNVYVAMLYGGLSLKKGLFLVELPVQCFTFGCFTFWTFVCVCVCVCVCAPGPAESLRRVFSWLGFQVEVVRDATRDQMLSSMRELASRDHSWMDCVACVVLSHGLEGGVYGVDGGVVRLKELTDVLNGVRCASLRGKPKLFFIQACQGNKREQASPSCTGDPCSDAVEEWIPTSADFLTAMATTPSYRSMRVEDRGSWFIHSLCQNLVKLVPRGQDLARILTTVHNDVGNKSNRIGGRRQMPQHHTSLRTRLVFPVPEGPLPSPYKLRDQGTGMVLKGYKCLVPPVVP